MGLLMSGLATYGLHLQEGWSGSSLGLVLGFALALLVTPLLNTPPLKPLPYLVGTLPCDARGGPDSTQ